MRPLTALLVLPLLGACGNEGPTVTVNGRRIEVPAHLEGLPKPAELERLKAGNDKAAQLGKRPLTPADVERYLTVTSALGSAETARDLGATLDQQGLSPQEWAVLGGRLSALLFVLERGLPNEKLAADVETVRPYLERIKAAKRRK